MNNNYNFRFYTRTRGQDYRVFVDDGWDDKLGYENDFEPLQKKNLGCSGDSPCVVLFEENEHIYLVCSNLFRKDAEDIFGRKGIYFSFCWIAPNKEAAYNVFSYVVRNWTATEEKMLGEQGCLTELDNDTDKRTQEQIWGKTVDFDVEKFLRFLQGGGGGPLKFENKKYEPGEIVELPADAHSAIWPPEGFVFYWEKEEDCSFIEFPIICLSLNSQSV